MSRTVICVAFAFAGIFASVPAQSDVVSTFDAGLQGWTTDNTGTFQHQPAGGNPGGYLYLDNDELGVAHIFAPAAFLGNLSGFNGGTFSFDGNLLGVGGSFYNAADDYGVIQISGPGGTATLDLLPGGATATFQSWTTYSTPLTAAAFGLSELQWQAILANVTEFRITIEALFGPEIEGVDNIRLAGASAAPEPASLGAIGTALLGLGVLYHRSRRRIRGSI